MDILHEKSDGRRSPSFFMTERRESDGKLKEIHLVHHDSGSSNPVILGALEEYGVKTGDILPPRKEEKRHR